MVGMYFFLCCDGCRDAGGGGGIKRTRVSQISAYCMIVIYKKHLDFLIFLLIFKCLCTQESCSKNKQTRSIIILKKKKKKKKRRSQTKLGEGVIMFVYS